MLQKPGYKTVFVSRTEFTEKSADALYQESSKAASPIPGSTSESMFRQFNANAELSRPGHPKNSLMASPLVIGLSAIGAFLCSVLLFENVDSIASLFRRSHDVASAGMDAGAGKIDRAILQLNVVPKIKIGEQLSPQSSEDVPDKWASSNPISPGSLAPGNQSPGDTNSLTLASNDLVPGNFSPSLPNTVPTTGFPGLAVDGLTQQLLSALPSPVQTATATVTTQPEHIVRVIRETVVVRTVTKSAQAHANKAGQVVNGVTKSGSLIQQGTSAVRSTAATAGGSGIRTAVGPQTFGSGSSGAPGGFGAGGVTNAVGGVAGGFGGAVGGSALGLGGLGGSLGGGLGGTLGGTVSGASNSVGGIGGHH